MEKEIKSDMDYFIEDVFAEFDNKFGCRKNCQSSILENMLEFWKQKMSDAYEKGKEQ